MALVCCCMDMQPGERLELKPAKRRLVGLLVILLTRIVARLHVFKAQRANSRYLGDICSGLCPVEMGRVAWQNHNASRRKRLHLVAIKLIAETDVENARNDRVDAVLWMSVRHQLHP